MLQYAKQLKCTFYNIKSLKAETSEEFGWGLEMIIQENRFQVIVHFQCSGLRSSFTV